MFNIPFTFKQLVEIIHDPDALEEFADLIFGWYKEIVTDFVFTIFKVFTFQRSLWNKRLFPTIFYGLTWWSILIGFIIS